MTTKELSLICRSIEVAQLHDIGRIRKSTTMGNKQKLTKQIKLGEDLFLYLSRTGHLGMIYKKCLMQLL